MRCLTSSNDENICAPCVSLQNPPIPYYPQDIRGVPTYKLPNIVVGKSSAFQGPLSSWDFLFGHGVVDGPNMAKVGAILNMDIFHL